MNIIKIGGGAAIHIAAIIRDMKELSGPTVIIHGANAIRDDLARRLGMEKRTVTSISGYTSVLSDEGVIELQMMAYSGLRNKRIVELCQQNGINAVGLTGLDGQIIQARRNQGIRVLDGNKRMILRDFSGKPFQINRLLLDVLIANGFTPVLTVPVIDENGYAVNCENDDIVAVLHREMKAERVFQFIEAPGFLADAGDPHSLITKMSRQELEQWEERSEGRIKRKLLALRKLLEGGPAIIHICDGRVENPIRAALNGAGTLIA